MTRLRSLLAVGLLLTSSMALAQTLSVGTVTVPEGNEAEVDVSLALEGTQTIVSATAVFTFDDTALNFVRCDENSSPPGSAAGVVVNCQLSNPGEIQVDVVDSVAPVDPIPGDVIPMATVVFGTAGQTATLPNTVDLILDNTFSECVDGNLAQVTCTLTSGSVTITAASPDISFDPDPVNFGNNVLQNSNPDPITVTVTNSGTAALTNTTATLTGTAYTLAANNCNGMTLTANGGTCTVDVDIADTSTVGALATEALEINGDELTTAVTVSVQGEIVATAPVIGFDPDPVNFGPVEVDSNPDPITVTVTNSGTAALTNTTATLTGTAYTLAANNCNGMTLTANGGTCTVDVDIADTSTVGALATEALEINGDELTTAVTVSVQGEITDVAPVPGDIDIPQGDTITFDPETLAPQTITISNATTGAGAQPITVTDISLTGNFEFTGVTTCPAATPFELGPNTATGSSCDVEVRPLATAMAGDRGTLVVDVTGDPDENRITADLLVGTPPPPVAIPTLSQWSMILMGSILALLAMGGLRRKES